MHCTLCGKHQATIYFKGIVNDQTVKMNICESCAKKKGMMFPFGKSIQSLGEMVSNLATESKLVGSLFGARCLLCGLSYAEFKETSQLGCSRCYSTFAPLVGPLLKRIQGSDQHIGKSYQRTVRPESNVQELSRLKLELREAIRSERFEDAAKLRDDIQGLEKQLTERLPNRDTR